MAQLSSKEKKDLKQKRKEHAKNLVLTQKYETKKTKNLHKETKRIIKADKPVQKLFKKEFKKLRKERLKDAPKRVLEAKQWWKTLNEEDKTKTAKKHYKWRLENAKKPIFNFAGDIKFENVSLSYSKNTPFEFRALDGTNLTIKKGKITAIIGMTGSGKSTLIQLTNGLLKPETGRTIIGDYPLYASIKKIKDVKNLRKEIGLVFQFPEYQLFQDTIGKDISFGPINLGGDKEEAIKNVPKLLKMVDLPENYENRSPFDLSGGQKRRVAIAGIIAMDGNTLVLDEPTGGLDPQGEEDFMNLFNRLNKKQKKRIIIVTHNMDHVLKIADEVVVMHNGKVISSGTPFDIFSDHELLKRIEIEPPKLYKLAYTLKAKGLDVTNKNFRTIKELAQIIKEVKGETK